MNQKRVVSMSTWITRWVQEQSGIRGRDIREDRPQGTSKQAESESEGEGKSQHYNYDSLCALVSADIFSTKFRINKRR
jgi:hypothetical protein